MKNGKNVADIRITNRALLLDCIYKKGEISRKSLSQLTGLTPASVTQITSELLSDQILTETEKRLPQNRTGRSEQLLDIRKDMLYAVSVTISGSELLISLSDMNLISLKTLDLPLPKQEELISVIEISVDSLIKEYRDKIIGIGVSLRGKVNSRDGVSIDSYGILPCDYPIGEILSQHYPYPITVENNVRSMLTAHSLTRPEETNGVALFIKYGPGVGGALTIDGKNYYGSSFSSCEVGHVCIEDGGEMCICGKRGCLETMLRYQKIEAKAKRKFSVADTPVLFSICNGEIDAISVEKVFAAYEQGDKGVANILKNPLSALALAVASSVAMYDPDTILLCSEFFTPGALTAYLEAEIKKRSESAQTRICFVSNKEELARMGAAASAIKRFLSAGGMEI